tara:strand:+ start:593 stop:1279 length:687 start_codon:yes stop_codon:yes gene_type:complete
MINNKIKILFLFIKTISSYGIINSIKIIFFEILGLIILRDIKSLSYNDESSSSYLDSKKLKRYNVPYIPTPYYFLYLIKNFLLTLNSNKINLIDIGCGYCRPAKYLSKKFYITFVGVELDRNISNEITKEKNKNFKIYNFNLRNIKKTSLFLKKNIKTNTNNLLLLSDTVEIDLINKILNMINNKANITLVLINTKYKKLKIKNFKIIKKILFKHHLKNIIFLDNNIK